MTTFIDDTRDRIAMLGSSLAGHPRFRFSLRAAGALLVLAAVQAWAFGRATEPGIETAAEQLAALQQEVNDNRLANLTLQTLQEYWDSVDDEATRRRVLELRDNVVDRFPSEPAAAVAELARVTKSFEARDSVEQEVLALLADRVERLDRLYTDWYAKAIDTWETPPWYLQPTAGLLNNDRERSLALAFNHALYLVEIRDAGTALEIFDELRDAPEFESGPLRSRLLFAMARLQFQAYQVQKDPGFVREALQYAQQSARADAGFELPKVFLEYLLSIDRDAAQVDMSPMEGEGTGEGEGERGAIVSAPEDF